MSLSLDNHAIYIYYIHCSVNLCFNVFFRIEESLMYYKFIIRFFIGYMAVYKRVQAI
jgi:hypothetical protein